VGQQQLLLLVLGVVVVGIAVAAGIQVFTERSAVAHRQAAIDGALAVVTTAQRWKLSPGALGGGGSRPAGDFSGISFGALGYEGTASGLYLSSSGCYVLSGGPGGAMLNVYTDGTESACDETTRVGMVSAFGTNPHDVRWSFGASEMISGL